MFAILGWVLAGLLALFIAGGALYLYIMMVSAKRGVGSASRELMDQFERDSRDTIRAMHRDSRFRKVERDLDFAQRLMDLEEQVHKVRMQYAHRGKSDVRYSREVEETIELLDADIARLKQGRP